jgi:hypothetical protein
MINFTYILVLIITTPAGTAMTMYPTATSKEMCEARAADFNRQTTIGSKHMGPLAICITHEPRK